MTAIFSIEESLELTDGDHTVESEQCDDTCLGDEVCDWFSSCSWISVYNDVFTR